MDGGGRQDGSYPVTCADIALSVIRVVRRYDYIETLPWWLLPPPIMGLADRVLRVRSYEIVGIDISLEERPGDILETGRGFGGRWRSAQSTRTDVSIVPNERT